MQEVPGYRDTPNPVSDCAASIGPVGDLITAIPSEEFLIRLPVGTFTDQEIAHWIRSNRIKADMKLKLARGIETLKGGRPITGVLRTAVREMEGLPPIPGDDV